MSGVRAVVLALAGVLLWASTASAAEPARTKPGPVDLRGIALHVAAGGFSLQTTHRGTYAVVTQTATQVVEKGRSGRLLVHEGDHVGVKGFLTGRTIRAIRVRIYPPKPKKPKPYNLRGTVVSVAAGQVTVAAGGKQQVVALGASTAIRVGRAAARANQIHPGDRVRMRVASVNGRAVALSIYVYVTHPTLRHVRVHGAIRSVAGGQITVAVGSAQTTVTVTRQTSIRYGTSPVRAGALRPGETVTVYACCQGEALVATSIHIDKTVTARHTYDLRGRVTTVSGHRLQVQARGKATTVTVAAQATVQIGGAPARLQDIHAGDDVTLRVYRSGTAVIAERVHVLAASRALRSVRGTVVAVGHGTVTVVDRGRRVTVAVGPSVPLTLDGKRASLAAVHAGDRIHLQIQGTATPARVTRVTVVRPAPKTVTVRGTVSQVIAGGVIIVDSSGSRHVVKLASGVRPRLHGQEAPASALFPGVRAHARGHLSGGTLIATSLTISATSRTIRGRLIRANAAYLTVQGRGSEAVRVDVPRGVTAADGTARVAPASLPAGVYLRAAGWVEGSNRLRATALTIEHPSVSVAATVIATAGGITVQDSVGDRYRLRFVHGSEIVVSRLQVPIKAADIPVGTRVHVDGTIDSAAMLVVSAMTVRLASVTLRGHVSQAVVSWMVRTPAGEYTLRVRSDTPVTQGSHVLTLNDIVPGDDVTVYGYVLTQSTVLVRTIDVHRRLEALDGTVSAVNPDGFVLQAADGQHGVLTSASTLFSGTGTRLAPGLTVHVTGYLRGDGAILATRVRVGRAR